MTCRFDRALGGAALAVLAVAIGGPALAAPVAEAAVDVRLAAGPLDAALHALARQTGVQILFTSRQVAGRRAPAVSGRMSPDQALARLLDGSDLIMQRAGARVLVVKSRPSAVPAAPAAMETASPAPASFQALASTAEATTASSTLETRARPQAEDVTALSEIVVGTHLRGVRDTASPVIVLGRDELDRAGRTSVADALSALPQAFTGTASEDTIATGADPLGTNSSRATGVNLRGLGADATLVLVNGRRLAGAGLKGDLTDVSSIPMAAVERIEILLDGASALYGSDAVGGVVNIVLRKRFDGAETRLLAGGATRGDATQWSVGQTIGHSWDSGQAVVSLEHSNRDRVRGRDRAFAGDANLTRLGGTDRRRFYASPGNILRPTASGALAPAYAIPAGQSGTGLTPTSFLAGRTNLENQQLSYDVLPRQRRDSLYLYLAQALTPAIEVSADARATRRRFTNRGGASVATLTVTRANPYFVSPTGAASERIAYSFQNELGGQRVRGRADTTAASIGLDARLPAGWRAEAYGAYGVEEMASLTSNLTNASYLAEALGAVPDNPASAFSTASAGYFNPFIGTGANPREILDFVGSGYIRRKTRGDVGSVNLKLDGQLWRLPAGAIGLAIGGQSRRESLKVGGDSQLSGYAPTPITRKDAHRTVNALFAELRAPLFGGEFTRPGLKRLELSAAVRREDYGDGVHSTDPKLGLIWSPTAGATLKASYGTSFRAPALTELSDPQIFAPTTITNGATQTIVMILYGGNPQLKPETATSRALTLDLAPTAWPRFKATITAFDTRFTNRIGQPGNENLDRVLTSAEFAPFVTRVSPGANAADLARIQALIDDPRSFAQGVFPAQAYGAIVDGRFVNTGQLRVRGLDVSARYEARLGADPLLLSADISWLADYRRKITPGSNAVDRAGFTGEPADFRARYAAAWTHGALTTTAALNHVGDLSTDTGARVKAWRTVDLNLGYAFGPGRLEGSRLSLNIQNLFDRDPPFFDALVAVGYDPANADPLGRLVTLQLTKTW
jgi:outer membrane receptor protein involved in Fe transport